MKVILRAIECTCGYAIERAPRPFDHLAFCPNRECAFCGVFVEYPQIEVKPGKAHSQQEAES